MAKAFRTYHKGLPRGCKSITFHSKRGRATEVIRCEGRKLKGHNKKQCRVGGKGPKAHLFKKCGKR